MKKNVNKILTVCVLLLVLSICLVCFVACDEKANAPETKILADKDIVFKLDTNKTSVWEMPAGLVLDSEHSYLKLKTDGQLEMSIKSIELNSLLDLANENFDLEKLYELDFNKPVEQYAEPFFPGFTLQDIPNSVKLVEKSMHCNFTGIDFKDENIEKIINSIKNTGKLSKPLEFPENFTPGVDYKNCYEYKNLKDVNGKNYKSIYVGEYAPNGQPYFILTQFEDANQCFRISLDIEFMKLHIEFVNEKKAQ